MSIAFLLWYAPDINFRRAANRHLLEHFLDRSERVWRATRTWQSQLAPNRPRYSTSVNYVMRYIEWSCALYRAAQECGMSQAEAAALVETVCRTFINLCRLPCSNFHGSAALTGKSESNGCSVC